MKIEYRKQIDSETAPWQLLTNMDELLWNGVYALRVTDDDGSHNLPFRFNNDDTVTLVVKDHAHEGMLENGRTVVQTITRVDRTTGNVFIYTRTRYNVNGEPGWNYWALATEGEAVIEMPKATPVSLGAVIVGDGLAVDADGKLSLAEKSIGEEYLTTALNYKINKAAIKAGAIDLFVQNSALTLHYGALLQNDAPYPGTNLRVHTDKILSGGELLVVNEGYVISAIKIFDGGYEIAYADNLNEKEYPLDAKGMHYQFEFNKLNMTSFTDDELPQVIKAYQRRPIVWSSTHHIDHFVAAGTYNISGQRTNAADGLPIANAASGHSINARLVVLDSSIPDSSKESDKCITQVLILSNRVGNDGDIYVRTGRAADTAHLIAGKGWGTWGKLQQNIEVGQTASLDGYIDNGIYSGVYTNGSTFFETFVMVVINNYAIAAATGTARNITQVKYAVDTNGVFCYHVRNGQGNEVVEWGEWRDLDAVTTAHIQDGAVTAQKLSAEVKEKVENPLRPLYIAAGAVYNENTGFYELNGVKDLSEADIMTSYIYKDVVYHLNVSRILQGVSIRTIYPFAGHRNAGDVFQNVPISGFCTFTSTKLELLKLAESSPMSIDSTITAEMPCASNIKWDATFMNCYYLRQVWPIDVRKVPSFSTTVFKNCNVLTELRLFGVSCSLHMGDCVNISKASVLYIINNSQVSSTIAITLHPDAYARLADDADIVAALEAQPLISLVSA